MSDWTPENDCELTEVYAGAHGDSYAKVLVGDAFERLAERIMGPYFDGKESLDIALTKIETLEQPQPLLQGIREVIVRQFADNEIVRDDLLRKLDAPLPPKGGGLSTLAIPEISEGK